MTNDLPATFIFLEIRFLVDFQISNLSKSHFKKSKIVDFYPKKSINVFLIILIYLIILRPLKKLQINKL